MYKNEMTWRIRVYGIVQGVGFRPTVSRHATNHGIYGTVCNKGPYVEIYAQGTKEQIDGFLNSLKEHPPKRAAVLKINTEDITADTTEQFEHFDIIESEKTKGEIFISPDIAICDECKEEMFDPKDRRYLHPFINCTCCGPRLTILDALPYDRERTSMTFSSFARATRASNFFPVFDLNPRMVSVMPSFKSCRTCASVKDFSAIFPMENLQLFSSPGL